MCSFPDKHDPIYKDIRSNCLLSAENNLFNKYHNEKYKIFFNRLDCTLIDDFRQRQRKKNYPPKNHHYRKSSTLVSK